MNPEAQGEGLEVRGWSVGWGGELLQGPLDLTIHGGERIALIGPSGSGKSASGTTVHRLVGTTETRLKGINVGSIFRIKPQPILDGHTLPPTNASY